MANCSAVAGSSGGGADGGTVAGLVGDEVGGGSVAGRRLGVGVGAGVAVGGAGLGVAVAVSAGVGVGTFATGAPVRWRPIHAPAPMLSTKAIASTAPYWIQRALFKVVTPAAGRAPQRQTLHAA